MRRAIRILAIAVLALVLQPLDIASGAGRGWMAASCQKGLLGVGKCAVVRCVGRSCRSVALPRGTALRARVSLGQCIGSYNSCEWSCLFNPPPGYDPYGQKQCLNLCDANHFACVDRAMTIIRATLPANHHLHGIALQKKAEVCEIRGEYAEAAATRLLVGGGAAGAARRAGRGH
jgi:hypothetical protein